MSVKRWTPKRPQEIDANGNPYSGGEYWFYAAGSTAPLDTYTDSTGTVANPNPVVLDASGRPQTEIWLTTGVMYKCVFKDADGATVWVEDGIAGINDASVTLDEWVIGPEPTYVSSDSFTLVGDQTSIFTVGRRVKIVDSNGTKYGTILSSAYTSVTTITLDPQDSDALSDPLASVSLGLISPVNTSHPILPDSIAVVGGSSDRSKRLRFEVDGFTSGTTRVITPPDLDVTFQQGTTEMRLGHLPAGIGPLPYAGSTIPTGWLECDGSEVSRDDYAELFDAIGTTWGEGNGVDTFNLPDMRGKMPIGAGTGEVVEHVTASDTNGFTVEANNDKWHTGMPVVLSDLTGFTTSASEGPTYYVVRISSTNIRLASTLALAQNGNPDVTISGSGTATLTHTYTARTLGEYGGKESHAMTIDQLLAHNHTQGAAGTASKGSDGGANWNLTSTGSRGGNEAMPIMNPFAVVKYIISY